MINIKQPRYLWKYLNPNLPKQMQNEFTSKKSLKLLDFEMQIGSDNKGNFVSKF